MASEVAKLVDALLMSIPGMNELVKLDAKIARKNILILCNVITKGLEVETVPAESKTEIEGLVKEYLNKGGLTEVAERLKAFQKA